MKKKLILGTASFFMILTLWAPHSLCFATSENLDLRELTTIENISPLLMLDWKVGDKMEYDVKMGFFGKVGTMNKEVTSENGEILVFQQKITMPGQNETVEVWINKNTGQVEKIIRNGKEEKIEDDGLEIIEQNYTSVTVAAGTFDAIYIHAKTKQVSKVEIWMNPQETCMDGTLKQVIKTALAPVEMELISFHKEK